MRPRGASWRSTCGVMNGTMRALVACAVLCTVRCSAHDRPTASHVYRDALAALARLNASLAETDAALVRVPPIRLPRAASQSVGHSRPSKRRLVTAVPGTSQTLPAGVFAYARPRARPGSAETRRMRYEAHHMAAACQVRFRLSLVAMSHDPNLTESVPL
jgi:hypothetical protein